MQSQQLVRRSRYGSRVTPASASPASLPAYLEPACRDDSRCQITRSLLLMLLCSTLAQPATCARPLTNHPEGVLGCAGPPWGACAAGGAPQHPGRRQVLAGAGWRAHRRLGSGPRRHAPARVPSGANAIPATKSRCFVTQGRRRAGISSFMLCKATSGTLTAALLECQAGAAPPGAAAGQRG